jgi:hypothetical protein
MHIGCVESHQIRNTINYIPFAVAPLVLIRIFFLPIDM